MHLLRRAPESSGTDLAGCLNALAELRIAKDDPQAAEPLLRQVFQIYAETLGPGHPTTAISLSNLAGFYVRQGNRDRAEPLLKKALRIQERAFGARHPELAATLKDLGFLYGLEKKFAAAEALLKRALDMEESTLGTTHPHLAVTLNQLSFVYIRQAKYALAEPLLERAVALESRSPAMAREAALSLNWLSLVRRNRRPEVRQPQRRIKSGRRALPAPSVSSYVRLYNDRGAGNPARSRLSGGWTRLKAGPQPRLFFVARRGIVEGSVCGQGRAMKRMKTGVVARAVRFVAS